MGGWVNEPMGKIRYSGIPVPVYLADAPLSSGQRVKMVDEIWTAIENGRLKSERIIT